MKRWSEEIKQEARRLRTEGLSYGELTKKLGISKSTLHEWIYDLKRPGFNREVHIKNIQALAVLANKKEREKRLSEIDKLVVDEINGYPLSDIGYLKSLLSMLYWAEGSKRRGTVIFANTDPKLSLLFITLLRKCYDIDESKLRVRIHLHHYHNIEKTKQFWSELLNVPQDKFGKIYIKPRSKTKKFRENFAGICFIKYHSENLRYEILGKAFHIQNILCS